MTQAAEPRAVADLALAMLAQAAERERYASSRLRRIARVQLE